MLRRFAKDESGSVVTIMALSTLTMLGAVGAGIDYTRMTNTRASLTAAVDAAALAAAQAPADKAAAVARQVFDANFRDTSSVTSFLAEPFDKGDDKAYRVEASASVQMTLTQVAGFDAAPARALSEVVIGSDNDVQAALVLDVTASMTGQKLIDLKSSSNNMVGILFDKLTRANQVKMSVVPFGNYVNVSLGNRAKPWMSVAPDSSVTTTTCSQVRDLIGQTNCREELITKTKCVDGVCTTTQEWQTKCTNIWSPYYEKCTDKTTNHKWKGCAGSRAYPFNVTDDSYAFSPVPGLLDVLCPGALTPLSSNRTTVINAINALTVSGETYIPAGLMWGWATLSPGEPFDEPTDSSRKTRRYLVLMTDGENTRSPNYPYHADTNDTLANTLTSELCVNIKAANIEIFTIAFDVNTDTVKNLLRNCASGSSKYFDAANSTQLASAFESIAQQMTPLRISR